MEKRQEVRGEDGDKEEKRPETKRRRTKRYFAMSNYLPASMKIPE